MIQQDSLVKTLQDIVRIPSHENCIQISKHVAKEIRNLGINPDVDAAVSVASGANFAVTNLGAFGIESHVPAKSVLNCATLAIGCVIQSFVPDANDNPMLRKQLMMTLAFDAGVIDRTVAARFIKEVQKLVENPMLMLAL